MHEIGGNTRVLGVIGNPVRHTMSPKIHNFLTERLGQDMVYLPFEVHGDVIQAVGGAYELGIVGMNVTVPYKSAVMEAVSETDAEACRIGAVNTLVRTDTGYKGYNTDVIGLRRELQEAGVTLAGEQVVILGAGGAARATAMMCAADGVSTLCILNRNREKAEELAAAVRACMLQKDTASGMYIQALGLEEYEQLQGKEHIVFQCTSVGLSPWEDEAVIEARTFYQKLKCAVDLIYTPRQTKFMKLAEHEGVRAMNGSKMLVYQAIASYELWNGMTIPEQIVNELLGYLTEEGLIG